MTDKAKYGRRDISKMLAQWNAHRAVCRAEGTPGVQSTLEPCEEWIDFALQPPAALAASQPAHTVQAEGETFQARVHSWMMACFC